MKPRSAPKRLAAAVLLSVLAVLGAAALWWAWEELSSPLPVYGELPDFTLEDARGSRVGLGDLRGKVWMADLIYTRCPDTCPFQSAEMAKLQKEFAGAEDFRLVSITVDPAYDTGPILARYAARFGADPDRWLFLRGDRREIARLAREGFRLAFAVKGSRAGPPAILPLARGGWFARLLGALGPPPALAHHPGHEGEPDDLKRLITHSSRFVLLDRGARIRGYYRSEEKESLEKLRADIRVLLGN